MTEISSSSVSWRSKLTTASFFSMLTFAAAPSMLFIAAVTCLRQLSHLMPSILTVSFPTGFVSFLFFSFGREVPQQLFFPENLRINENTHAVKTPAEIITMIIVPMLILPFPNTLPMLLRFSFRCSRGIFCSFRRSLPT